MSTKKLELAPTSKRFFQAVYTNNIKELKQVVKRDKVNPNVVDIRQPERPTALNYAAEKQNIGLARALLEIKKTRANVNVEDGNGKRPVWWAAQYGNIELAELLIKEHNCEVDYMDQKTGCTPLYRAIVTGVPEICTLLIHAGANVNLRRLGFDVGGESPLMKCVQMDSLDICKVLVNSLVDLNHRTDDGFTALHFAVSYHRYDILEFLLENKIKKHAQSNRGVTAMTIAIEHRNPLLVQILIKYGYNMNKKYKWGETPLQQAISVHAEKCALTLVYWGCNLKLKDGLSYLRLAAEAGLSLLIVLLVTVRPAFLAEEWIQERQYPMALKSESKDAIRGWLENKLTNPMTLREFSRAVLFQNIPYFPERPKKLSLPTDLLTYLKMDHVIDERMYKREKLVESCPLDCEFLHPATDIQCADIEISDIDGISDCSDIEETTSNSSDGEDNS